MTRPIVFTRKGRTYWLEAGQLWRWHLVLWRWWNVPARLHRGQVSGDVLTEEQVAEVISSKGTPFFPRVEAGCWLPCSHCGEVSGALRVYLGTRPFCSELHRARFIEARQVVDSTCEARQNN